MKWLHPAAHYCGSSPMARSPQYGVGYQPRVRQASKYDEPSASSTPDLLLKLPTEVLQHIATFLCDFRASYALYRTCKTLQRAIARTVYSDISFHGWPQFPVGLYLTHARLRAFTYELDPPVDEDNPPTWLLDVDETLLLAAEAQARDVDEKRVWHSALRRLEDECLNADPVMALLLPSLPNLERVFFRMPKWAPFLERMLDRANEDNSRPSRLAKGDSRVLSNLREVVLIYRGDRLGMSPNLFTRFIRLPSVRCMRAYYMGTADAAWGGGDLQMEKVPPGSSACESLEIVDSRLSDNDLHIILAACRNLKILRYQLSWGYLSWSSPTVSSLQASLRLHVASLEQLWLDLNERVAVEIDDILYTPMRFGDFKKLRHLKINPAFLLTKDELQGERDYRSKDGDAAGVPFAIRILNAIPASLQRLYFTNLSTGLRTITEGCIQLLQGYFVVRKPENNEAYVLYTRVGSRWGMDGTCEVPELATDREKQNKRQFPPRYPEYGVSFL
ncbi:hypothetical protein GQ53DRAFT_805917 [Thozetella sp. PMI_491]|nr:hypothetical protein GQ53DRAFT_805917 [Thozetella sp. PMI_491]